MGTRDWIQLTQTEGGICRGPIVARNKAQIFLQLDESGPCGPTGELTWADRSKLGQLQKRSEAVTGKTRLVWSATTPTSAIGANTASPAAPSSVPNTVRIFSSGVKKGFRLRIIADGNAKGCSASLKGLDKDSLLVSYSGGTGCPNLPFSFDQVSRLRLAVGRGHDA